MRNGRFPVKPPHGKKGIRLTVVFLGFVGDEISYLESRLCPIFKAIVAGFRGKVA